VLLGTSAPLLTKFQATPGQVGPSFYNKVNLPIAMLVAFLLGLVPYLTWRGTGRRAHFCASSSRRRSSAWPRRSSR
jgi:cytochrome c biogenesis factor